MRLATCHNSGTTFTDVCLKKITDEHQIASNSHSNDGSSKKVLPTVPANKPKLTPDTGGCLTGDATKSEQKGSLKSPPAVVTVPKVLFVEDTAYNLFPIKAILDKKKVCTYDTAENGEIAVERYTKAVESGKYTAIFMDLEMPVMNGYEATQAIRALEESHSYPKVFICGLSASDDQGTFFV